jgi:hypothetical protein
LVGVSPLRLCVSPLLKVRFRSIKASTCKAHVVLPVLPLHILDLFVEGSRTILLVPWPVLFLALPPAVIDELTGAFQLASARVAPSAQPRVVQEIRHHVSPGLSQNKKICEWQGSTVRSFVSAKKRFPSAPISVCPCAMHGRSQPPFSKSSGSLTTHAPFTPKHTVPVLPFAGCSSARMREAAALNVTLPSF